MNPAVIGLVSILFLGGCLFGSSGTTTNSTSANNTRDAGASDANVDANGSSDVRGPDIMIPENCGDGALQANESCDPGLPAASAGACPAACDDGEVCTTDALVGSAQMCDAACTATVITACLSGDGCCPGDCDAASDTDCDDTAVCGDGVLTGAELCDPGFAPDAPEACRDEADCPPMQCQSPRVIGQASACNAECAYVPITSCTNGDGCCALGCDIANDDDCAVVCGNMIVDPGELCDGNCPSSCADTNACTSDVLNGSAATCDAECSFDEIGACINGDSCCPAGCDFNSDDDCSATCGNMVVDVDETCDDSSPDPNAACPANCNDMDECTDDITTGTSSNCNVVCANTAKTGCSTDGCCVPGCNANNDPDCSPACGNGFVEGAETCDGNCPASCDDMDACTTDTAAGSAGTCDLVCTHIDVTACASGDGCCPMGCNANNDNDCGVVCGNGVVEGIETCDGNCPSSCDDSDACTIDVRTGNAAQCDVVCVSAPITACFGGDGCCPSGCTSNNDSDCSASCGNNVVEGNETCDGNCPTLSECQALGGCYTLSGDPDQCTAECTMIPGCTACNLAGNCTCAASESCVGGRCQGPSGDCREACDGRAHCVATAGVGICDASDGDCKECKDPGDCQPWETCSGDSCEAPALCTDANDGNAYCQHFQLGDTCDASGLCYDACNVAADCPFPDNACYGNICQIAQFCSDANDPSWYCANVELYGDTCVQGACYFGCPGGDACLCPVQDLQECVLAPTGEYFCDEQLAASCLDVCDGNLYCENLYGPGWECNANSTGDNCRESGEVTM